MSSTSATNTIAPASGALRPFRFCSLGFMALPALATLVQRRQNVVRPKVSHSKADAHSLPGGCPVQILPPVHQLSLRRRPPLAPGGHRGARSETRVRAALRPDASAGYHATLSPRG